MPRIRPPYTGNGAWTRPKDFSQELRQQLRRFYPEQDAEPDLTYGDLADAFVASILGEASWAIDQLHWQEFDITKQEIRAERADLLNALTNASTRLRNLSNEGCQTRDKI